MQKPTTIVARGVELPAELEDEIRLRAARLCKFYPQLIGCSVKVHGPGRHHNQGGPYQVMLDIRVPANQPLLVNRQQHEYLAAAVGEAFDVAERQLEDLLRLQRGQIKTHEPAATARVARFIAGQDYGFLETPDGREIYFHKNSVVDGFENLRVGMEVRFTEALGEKGPQASTVVAAA